jgi:hypothetical protein
MDQHPIVALIALPCVMACGVASTIRIWDMVDELNRKLPPEDSFSHLGWHWTKYKRFIREYERCFPASPNPRYLRIVFCVMMASLIGGAWGLGFFR